MTNYWKRLKSYPYLYHLVLIAGVVAGLLLAAHFAMQLGTRHGQHRTVPDFTGLALDDAGRLAQRNSLELRVNDSLFVPAYDGGVVLDQLPHEGTQVKGGRTVYVTINSFSQKKVEVPYVAGRSLRQAKNMLEIAGLEIDRLVYQPDMATNYVLEQRVDGRPIEAGTKRQIEMGSGVTLYVGVAEGDSVVVVPKVIGVSLREADVPVFGIRNVRKADIARFQAHGCTCKLIAAAEQKSGSIRAYVEPTLLGHDALEAAVPANFNLISMDGDRMGVQSFFGQGAGRYPTAYNVVQDLVDIRRGVHAFYTDSFVPAVPDNSGVQHRYYVRTRAALPELAALAEGDWDGAVITQPVPVSRMHALMAQALVQDSESFFAALQ